jgi:hypothetical protein
LLWIKTIPQELWPIARPFAQGIATDILKLAAGAVAGAYRIDSGQQAQRRIYALFFLEFGLYVHVDRTVAATV